MLRRMADRTDEEHDFDLVDEFIRSPAGILLKRIMPVPGKGKRPDFEVLSPHGRADFGGLAAYMEVKSPRDDRLETLVENSQEGVIAGYATPHTRCREAIPLRQSGSSHSEYSG